MSTSPGTQTFDLGGIRITEPASTAAQELLAAAHADRVRPQCMCTHDGVEMYIARAGDRHLVKRMPYTAPTHATSCDSYLPPDAVSGLGAVLGHAIQEEIDTGRTALRLGFRMSKTDRKAPEDGCCSEPADSVATDGPRLTLRAVLHYLWQEADLSTWTPGMTGKRNWRVVAWYLRGAANGKFIRGNPLATRLFVPEPFDANHKAEITARRLAAWEATRQSGRGQQFLLLVGELKNIEPARFGHKLVIRHMPDSPVMIDDALLRRMQRRFSNELELWQADEHGHLMVIATVSVGRAGLATAEELSLVMTDHNWLPYESAVDKILLDAVTGARRRFTKSLRYNLGAEQPMATLVFTDTEKPTAAYLLGSAEERTAVADLSLDAGVDAWTWSPGEEPLPQLPPRTSTSAAHAATPAERTEAS